MTTQTVRDAAAQRAAGPVAVMWAERDKFRAVLPASVDVEAFLGTAAGALYADEKLMQAAANDMDSLIVALMKCAALGHLPGTDEYYLTPRRKSAKQGGGLKVLGIEGYRGIIERMYRSGAVAKVVVREVCAKDKFRYIEGVDDKPRHSAGGRSDDAATGADFFGAHGDRNRGEMVGVYAYAELLNGATSRVVLLSRDDVMAYKEASDAGDSEFSPWNRLDGGKNHPEFRGRSMWLKSGARRLEPWVPTSAEYRREQLRAASSAARLGERDQAALARAAHDEIPAGAVEAEIVHDDGPAAVGPGPAAEPRAVAAQLTEIGRHFSRLGYTDADDADRLRIMSRLSGAEVTDPRELTRGGAQQVAQALKGCKDKGEVIALLADGVKPGGGDD